MAVNWIELTRFEIARQTVSAPWLLVLETVEEMTRLQIKAEGSWTAIGGLPVMSACGGAGETGKAFSPAFIAPDMTSVRAAGTATGSGPDGVAGVPIAPDQLVISSCHIGALIAKIGGLPAASITSQWRRACSREHR